jgi:hypothetical protein
MSSVTIVGLALVKAPSTFATGRLELAEVLKLAGRCFHTVLISKRKALPRGAKSGL